ncbi:MAG: S8 family serine peptidase, partial [Xanthomonadales bacterium]|nr:S8 family serine peptidase [Xanthomonadales bacterium]
MSNLRTVTGPTTARLTPLAAALTLALCGTPALAEAAIAADAADQNDVAEISAQALYIVQLRESPLATYAGEIDGLPAPARLADGQRGKLDLKAQSSIDYVDHLQESQADFLAQLATDFGREIETLRTMQHALNAVVIGLSEAEAAALLNRPEVQAVEREQFLTLDTYNGPGFIGAPTIWEGTTANGTNTRGEGIVVGIIDSGINWASPAYAATGPVTGHVHVNPNGSGNFLGQCQTGQVDAGRCNDKLIGIYNMAAPGTTGTDTDGHGSHTSSTTAGNVWDATFANGTFRISGVAPHANVIAYLACPDSCPTTATTGAVNQAVIDGVDVINYSISGGVSPWTDSTSTAFRNAHAAGVYISASAGNTRAETPDPQGNVNHLEPWVHTVAASTHDAALAMVFDLGGASPPPSNTQGLAVKPGGLPIATVNIDNAPLIKSPTFADGSNDGCSAFPANTFTRIGPPPGTVYADGFEDDPVGEAVGAIAVLHLDGTASNCASGVRRGNALAAGAIGVIYVDSNFLNLGANMTSWSMRRADWDLVEAGWDPASATASIDVTSQIFPNQGDLLANFSLRGPRLISTQGIVKPDITAPGVDILAAGAAGNVGDNGVFLNSGTSMSSPHNAGAAALMTALYPTLTPSEIKSALMLSARNTGAV